MCSSAIGEDLGGDLGGSVVGELSMAIRRNAWLNPSLSQEKKSRELQLGVNVYKGGLTIRNSLAYANNIGFKRSLKCEGLERPRKKKAKWKQ